MAGIRDTIQDQMNHNTQSLAFKLKSMLIEDGEKFVYQNVTDFTPSTFASSKHPEINKRNEKFALDRKMVGAHTTKLLDKFNAIASSTMRSFVRHCHDESEITIRPGTDENTIQLCYNKKWTGNLTPLEASATRGAVVAKNIDAIILDSVRKEMVHGDRPLKGPNGITMADLLRETPEPSEQEQCIASDNYGINTVVFLIQSIAILARYIRETPAVPPRTNVTSKIKTPQGKTKPKSKSTPTTAKHAVPASKKLKATRTKKKNQATGVKQSVRAKSDTEDGV